MKTLSLLLHYSLPFFSREAIRLTVVCFGIVLSVALFTAVRMANISVISEFESAVDAMSGASHAQILARSGMLSENVIPVIIFDPHVKHVIPLSKQQVFIQTASGDQKKVWLAGTDILNEAFQVSSNQSASTNKHESGNTSSALKLLQYGTVLVSPALESVVSHSQELQLAVGDESWKLNVLQSKNTDGLFALYEGNLVVADMSLYQELTGTFGEMDQLNVVFHEHIQREEGISALQKILPDSVRLVQADDNVRTIAQSSEALRMNITFLSALSLFVAVLLSYQVMSVVSFRRREDFASLISLGASPMLVFSLFLLETIVLGFFSGGLGSGLGYLLSHYTTAAVQGTIHHLYTPLWMRGVQFSWQICFEGIGLGVMSSLLGAMIPAYVLLRKPPKSYFSRNTTSRMSYRFVLSLFGLGLVSVVLGMLASSSHVMRYNSVTPFLPPSLLAIGVVCAAPLILWVIGYGAMSIPITACKIACDWLLGRLRDNGVTVGALGVTFGMLIGVTTMIDSFRGTFEIWLQQILRADVFISSQQHGKDIDRAQKNTLLNFLRQHSDVAAVNTGDEVSYIYEDKKIFVRSTNMSLLEQYRSLVLLHSTPPDWNALKEGKAVFISEPMSRKFALHPGESISLSFAKGTFQGVIAGVFQDFSSDLGAVLFDQAAFDLFAGKNRRGLGMSVYLHPEASSGRVLSTLQDTYGADWNIRNRNALKSEAIKIFNNTFAITYVLQMLTLGLACLFFFNTMILSVLEKRRQCLTLRSIGAPFSFLRAILLSEAILLVFGAFILGGFLGALLSYVLVYRINILFFGWLVQLAFPFHAVLTFSAGLLCIGFLAAVIVSSLFLRSIPMQALRYE